MATKKRSGLEVRIVKNKKIFHGKLFLLLGIALLLLFCGAPAIAAEYRIGKRDVLDISVWGHSDLRVQSQVLPDGALLFPLAGSVEVVGKTVEEVREVLAERLSVYLIDPQVLVMVVNATPLQVKVIGDGVKIPGIYSVPPDAQILDAITMAGGPSKEADLARVIVINPETMESRELKLGEGFDYHLETNQTPGLEIVDGMIVQVPSRIIRVRIFGEVKASGTFELKTGSFAADAVAMAGGPTSRSDLARVRVASPKNPEGVVVKVGRGEHFLKNLETGPELQDGMTVYVPETVWPDWTQVALYITIISGLMKIFGL